MKIPKGNKKGFTLVEIVVVLVIMGILLAIAVPSVIGYVKKAEDAKWQSYARGINLDVTSYMEQYMAANPKSNDKFDETIAHFKLKFKPNKGFLDNDIVDVVLPHGYKIMSIDVEFDNIKDYKVDQGGSSIYVGWGYDKTKSKHTITKISIHIAKSLTDWDYKFLVTIPNKGIYIYDSFDDGEKAVNEKLDEAPIISI